MDDKLLLENAEVLLEDMLLRFPDKTLTALQEHSLSDEVARCAVKHGEEGIAEALHLIVLGNRALQRKFLPSERDMAQLRARLRAHNLRGDRSSRPVSTENSKEIAQLKNDVPTIRQHLLDRLEKQPISSSDENNKHAQPIWDQFLTTFLPQKPGPITKNAGLIVTFYGPRSERMSGFMKQLGVAFGLVIQAFLHRADLWAPDKGTYLRSFDPPAAPDTTVVQLALNGSDDDALIAWETLRQKLETEILGHLSEENLIWGYTLIYHAALVNERQLDEHTQDELFRLARRPNLPSQGRVRPLAHTSVSGGKLWLMNTPLEGNGAEAAMVYVALSQGENDFITKVLYGPDADLLMPDLIAHKGYHQKRQYMGEPRKLYQELMWKTQKTVNDLRELSIKTNPETKSVSEINERLTNLRHQEIRLSHILSMFDDLRLSLALQLENYEWWQNQLGEGNLTEYHRRQIQTAYKDIDILTNKGKDRLEKAGTTIDRAEKLLEKTGKQPLNQIVLLVSLLAFALVFLALNQNLETTQSLLYYFNVNFVNSEDYFTLIIANIFISMLMSSLITFFVIVAYRRK